MTTQATKKALLAAQFSAIALLCALPALAAAPDPVQSAASTQAVPWAPADVIALAEKVGDWQLSTISVVPPSSYGGESVNPTSWQQGALFVGLTALADHSQKPQFKDAILARGKQNGWNFGPRQFDADDQVIGSAYLWAAQHGADPEAIATIRGRMDAILANPPKADLTFVDNGASCRDRWCWADALFMAPPVWFEMSKVTGDPKYAAFAAAEFQATTDKLYDTTEHLYFRDSRFFDRRDINGKKVFWSRGDGWVFAGLARSISLLPANDPERARMIVTFKEMAAKLKTIQKADGYWSPSLLGDPETSLPESSGTGFYTYGFAWGVKAGILDRAAYEPVVRSGWQALVRAVHPDGVLGYVQPVSDRPDNVEYSNTQFYGTGAFLMAAGAVADLNLAPIAPLKARLTLENPSRFDQPAAKVSVPAAKIAGVGPGNWSVVASGRTYAAQYNPAAGNAPATISFVLPMTAHQKTTVQFVPQEAPLPQQTQAILNVQEGGTLQGKLVTGGVFHLRKDYKVPADHFIHDGVIAFEGIGWESDKVAYRLYLDERSVTDIYGKKVTYPILQSIGQNHGDYHSMNDWGQDIFQVDQSLGIGGVGIVRVGKATQVGKAQVVGHASNEGPISATATVDNLGFDGGKANLTTHYHITSGSAVTMVDAAASGASGPIAAGLVHHKDMTVFKSETVTGDWGYIASWGQQSLAGDNLGIVLFFPEKAVASRFNDDGQTLFVTFKDPAKVHYGFAATWVQDGSNVRDLDGFKAYIAATIDGLNHPVRVVPAGKKH